MNPYLHDKDRFPKPPARLRNRVMASYKAHFKKESTVSGYEFLVWLVVYLVVCATYMLIIQI